MTEKKTELIETLAPVKFDLTKAGLSKLKKRCALFTTVPESPADYKALTVQLAEVRTTRTSIEARRKELKAPLLDYGRQVDGLANGLKAALLDLEAPLIELKKKADEIKAAEKKAKAEAEMKRIADLNAKLAEIRAVGNEFYDQMDDVLNAIEGVEALVIDAENYQEFIQMAEVTRQEVLAKLRGKAAQIEDAILKEQERLQAEAEAEEARKEEEARLEAQRLEQEAQQEKLREQQAKLDAQQAELDEKQRIQEEQERKEQEAKEAAEREKREKEAAEQLKKEAAAQARKQKAWKKKALADMAEMEAYLAALMAVKNPNVSTPEFDEIYKGISMALNEFMGQLKTQADGLKTLAESDD